MLLLANTINTLNEKEFRYKVNSEAEGVSIVFGFISQGQKVKVEILPKDETVGIRLSSSDKGVKSEKEVDKDGIVGFLDAVLEIKALNEQESTLFNSLVA